MSLISPTAPHIGIPPVVGPSPFSPRYCTALASLLPKAVSSHIRTKWRHLLRPFLYPSAPLPTRSPPLPHPYPGVLRRCFYQRCFVSWVTSLQFAVRLLLPATPSGPSIIPPCTCGIPRCTCGSSWSIVIHLCHYVVLLWFIRGSVFLSSLVVYRKS